VIRIEIDEPTLARTRIAISPLAEVSCSLSCCNATREGAVAVRRVGRAAREILRTDRRRAAALYCSSRRASPDFLCPIPLRPTPTIEEQLDQLRATPPSHRRGAGEALPRRDCPRSSGRSATTGSRRFARLADGLAAYWEAAIAPYWPAMRAALDEEVLLRARALARRAGRAAVPAARADRWERPVLTLVKPLDQSFERSTSDSCSSR
jgi:hypothetical protein